MTAVAAVPLAYELSVLLLPTAFPLQAHIFLCVPFGGFGGGDGPPLAWYMRHALPNAMARHRARHAFDRRTHLVDLGPDAAVHDG